MIDPQFFDEAEYKPAGWCAAGLLVLTLGGAVVGFLWWIA